MADIDLRTALALVETSLMGDVLPFLEDDHAKACLSASIAILRGVRNESSRVSEHAHALARAVVEHIDDADEQLLDSLSSDDLRVHGELVDRLRNDADRPAESAEATALRLLERLITVTWRASVDREADLAKLRVLYERHLHSHEQVKRMVAKGER